jgi:hypothetical protein
MKPVQHSLHCRRPEQLEHRCLVSRSSKNSIEVENLPRVSPRPGLRSIFVATGAVKRNSRGHGPARRLFD